MYNWRTIADRLITKIVSVQGIAHFEIADRNESITSSNEEYHLSDKIFVNTDSRAAVIIISDNTLPNRFMRYFGYGSTFRRKL